MPLEQKADELRSATQSKAQELKGTAQSWQAEGHAYIRDNTLVIDPTLILLDDAIGLSFPAISKSVPPIEIAEFWEKVVPRSPDSQFIQEA